MKYKIIHESDYTFDSKVFIEPHYFRFKTRTTPFHKVENSDLQIHPNPVGLSEVSDIEGNIVHLAWFEGLHDKLSIHSTSIVEITEYNPFNFILYPVEFNKVPFEYSTQQLDLLRNALQALDISDQLIDYGKEISKKANANTTEFLTELTRKIQNEFSLIYRHEGPPQDSDKTFRDREGSCRDLAWMQIQLLRNIGIASRFVSGYYYLPLEKPDYELHAWLEVFLPGAGWIGFDPSHGIITGSTHIPIAVSSIPENTMPVTGTVRGTALSKLKTNLSIEPIE